ncbi:MAG TPA: hypothetical protein VHO29_18450 [Marmoricola sp.]|nr:hypothetical protein [Marmoricola sp.]
MEYVVDVAGWLDQRVAVEADNAARICSGLAVHEYEYVSYRWAVADMIVLSSTPAALKLMYERVLVVPLSHDPARSSVEADSSVFATLDCTYVSKLVPSVTDA